MISCLAIASLSGARDGVGEAVVGDADGSSVARAPCEQPLAARATAMAAAAAHAGRRGMDTVKPSHSGNSAANCAIAALGAKSTCELSRPLYPGANLWTRVPPPGARELTGDAVARSDETRIRRVAQTRNVRSEGGRQVARAACADCARAYGQRAAHPPVWQLLTSAARAYLTGGPRVAAGRSTNGRRPPPVSPLPKRAGTGSAGQHRRHADTAGSAS